MLPIGRKWKLLRRRTSAILGKAKMRALPYFSDRDAKTIWSVINIFHTIFTVKRLTIGEGWVKIGVQIGEGLISRNEKMNTAKPSWGGDAKPRNFFKTESAPGCNLYLKGMFCNRVFYFFLMKSAPGCNFLLILTRVWQRLQLFFRFTGKSDEPNCKNKK